ncbi:hypothetical protein RvY_17312 [Ramazzottius varieornatus]|uniref:GST C-terminal domain-containing protein n=1 Tax=Ramazzottius varieornatus TaxID=947166 RepID=A0A1D1W1P3_RAMVA|nr:hypothetical protein RvY_17312 [Ramazzottius varieornatus]
MQNPRHELEVWRGDWQLLSIDPECLRAAAYVRLSGAPVSIVQNAEPWSIVSGAYPVLRGENKSQISGADAIVKRLRSDGFRCPHEANQMTTYEEADAYALEGYIKSSLSPLLDYLWWADEEFFQKVAQPWYTKELSLYGQFVWTNRQKKRMLNRFMMTPDAQISEAKVKLFRKQTVQKARRCLEDLSVKLSDKTFLFGLQPSALDACAFAYLAPLFYIPWKSKEIRKELFMDNLDKFKNLKLYVDRFRKRFMEGSAISSVRLVQRPVRWYHRALEQIQKQQDILLFATFAIAVNVYLLRRTVRRLRFSWPAFENHARQKVQDSYAEMAKNLGMKAEMQPGA